MGFSLACKTTTVQYHSCSMFVCVHTKIKLVSKFTSGLIGSRHGESPRQRRLLIGDGKRELFHGPAHDMRLDHEHERRIDVPQLELGESGRLQVFPGFPGDQATVSEVIPGRLENVLEEVGPCGGAGNHMLHEEEGSTLQSTDETVLLMSVLLND